MQTSYFMKVIRNHMLMAVIAPAPPERMLMMILSTSTAIFFQLNFIVDSCFMRGRSLFLFLTLEPFDHTQRGTWLLPACTWFLCPRT